MNEQFGAGGFFTTEIDAVDLGEHHGLRLEGRVQRRTLRLGLGGRRGVRIELARKRPTSILAIGPAGETVHRVPSNPDPWIEAAQRLVALTVATSLLPWLIRRSTGIAREAAE